MKFVLLAALAVVSMGASAQAAEMGDSWDRDTVLAVSTQRAPIKQAPVTLRVKLHSTAAGCSTGGDETARPVYAIVDGVTVFAGYECVQDNRGGNGG
jgi:hypothetical protein